MAETLHGKADGRAPRRASGWRVAALVAVIGLAAAGLGADCNGGQRFPVCKSNAECAARGGGTGVCFNLKCVACQYDTDCGAGEVCSSVNECQKLEDRAPAPAESGPVRWDPGSWNECAEHCKDQACLKKCSEKFEK